MNFYALFFGALVASIAGAIEYAPTKVGHTQFKTAPPSETAQNNLYVQTVYKETDHKTLIHTVQALQPSYVTKYQSTSYSTVNNQTIRTASVEFSTTVNSTVLYNTEDMQLYTYIGAPTSYEVIEFATQRVEYTPVTGNTTAPVTVTETNGLPFL